MFDKLLHKKGSNESDNPRKAGNSEIADIRQQLMKYINQTSQNFATLNGRINKIQAKVDKLPTEISGINGVDGGRVGKMETKIAQMSEEIAQINTVYANLKECLQELFTLFEKQQKEQKIGNGVDGDRVGKMETKIAQMSEEIAQINEAVYVNIKECLVEIFAFIEGQNSANLGKGNLNKRPASK